MTHNSPSGMQAMDPPSEQSEVNQGVESTER